MSSEYWKDIPNYEGLYQISNLGRVKRLCYCNQYGKSYKHDIFLKPRIKNGYQTVRLYKNGIGTEKTVHRLVATSFIPNEYNKPMIHHKNANKICNIVDNLEWVTNQENQLYAYREGHSTPTYGFKGHRHTSESKHRISKSLKAFYNLKGVV